MTKAPLGSADDDDADDDDDDVADDKWRVDDSDDAGSERRVRPRRENKIDEDNEG